jgi:hypothetical protein
VHLKPKIDLKSALEGNEYNPLEGLDLLDKVEVEYEKMSNRIIPYDQSQYI